jgi:hypothetical protein
LSVQLLRASGSPRAFSPRDDKSGIFTMKGVKWWSSHIVIARRTGWTTRQSIVFRESERGWRFGGEGQWIATPQEARDDKRELRDGAVRLLRVQWSATGLRPRDDKVGETVF